ncbi:chorismate pyruvate-lyase family protein [Clostridium sp. DJ247]|uniref:chorismate pyruvate-lyase family protein n=1 Tax=Clostridium sp. DJ247 TaxID=2726188 RepID=UPI001624119E|nr:chorismate pyruvate-lyase family protein [Clostridium sp. DJ247]MBC2580386.1 DUF98 domain-containing protein [Clostridium sp. DJ247]
MLLEIEKMKLGDIDLSSLNVGTRLMLSTNGTLTTTLETLFFEKVEVFKIFESLVKASEVSDSVKLRLNLCDEEMLLKRDVFLQGKTSKRNYVYATSYVAIDKLSPNFRDELVKSQTPIGYIWNRYKIPLYKEFISYTVSVVGDLAEGFQIKKDEILYDRTYIVYSDNIPITIITEKFPMMETNFK